MNYKQQIFINLRRGYLTEREEIGYIGYLNANLKREQHDEALDFLDHALRICLHTGNWNTHHELTLRKIPIIQKYHSTSEAFKTLDNAIQFYEDKKINPGANIYARRGKLLFSLSRYTEAARDYETANIYAEGHEHYTHGLLKSLFNANSRIMFKKFAAEALEAYPESTSIKFWNIAALRLNGNHQRAEKLSKGFTLSRNYKEKQATAVRLAFGAPISKMPEYKNNFDLGQEILHDSENAGLTILDTLEYDLEETYGP